MRSQDTKRCSRCKRDIPVAGFDRYTSYPHGLKGYCRACGDAREAPPPIQPPNPSGLCMCGCGEPAPIARQTERRKGLVAGHPMRFISGHNSKLSLAEYAIDPDTGCWRWLRGKSSGGYGMAWIKVDGVPKRVYAHRLVYERHKGAIPEDMTLDHVKARGCRYRDCVNPDHLEPVTHAENSRRGARAKLSHEAAATIRRAYPRLTMRELADQFGVHESTILDVIHGESWAPDL